MSISAELRDRVRKQANNRCGYCLSSQQYVLGPLEIDHIIPKAHGGTDDESNLWLACRMCNTYKRDHSHGRDPVSGDIVSLFNPRLDRWEDHFHWSTEATEIIGQTPCGRATVVVLQLNNTLAISVRAAWVTAGWHPP